MIKCLFFILCCNYISAQNKVFEVIYQVKSNVEKTASLEILLKAHEAIDKVEPTLIFNDSLAVYRANFKPVTIEENFALVFFCGCKYKQYYHLNSSSVYVYSGRFLDIKANQYLIKDSLKNNWVITNETKDIDGRKCYKATQFLTDNKKYKENITAWYCPELNTMNNVFGLKSLKQIESNELLTFPDTSKSITKEKFDLIKVEMNKEYQDAKERLNK
jgi:GLPGLI family protein